MDLDVRESRLSRRQLLAAATGAMATTCTALAPSLLLNEKLRGDEPSGESLTRGLVGHWPLAGDCQDRSGLANHGTAHGNGSEDGQFDGRENWIEVRPSDSLKFCARDFTISAWVWTA